MTDTHTTAHIPDEAVQAFKKEFHENSPKRSYDENIKCALTAAIRALSAEPAQGKQWQPIETAPKDGSTFLAVNIGEIERWHTTQEGVVITVKANDRPMTCACYNNDDGTPVFTDEFGEVYTLDGIVCDAEDMTAAENVLRLTCWMPLPAAPTTEAGK